MDITKKKIIKSVLVIILIILILLLNFLFLGGRSYSSYKKRVNGKSVTEVAKPVFQVNGADDIIIDGIEDTVYNFSVQNYNNTERSEVDIEYYIQVVNNTQANLEFILKKDGRVVSLSNNKTDLISLSSLRNQKDNYELQIKYHNNPATVGDISGNVQIKVEAVQSNIN